MRRYGRGESLMSAEEDRAKAQAVCDWILADRPGPKSPVTNESAVPVRVTIGEKSWLGALYCVAQQFEDFHRCVNEGPMQAGEWDRNYRLYLVGARPHKNSGHLYVYDLPESHRKPLERCYAPDNEWYMACYWEGNRGRFTDAEINRYHPFGPSVILSLHQIMNFGTYKDQKIDHYDGRPSVRHPMTVEYLTTETKHDGEDVDARSRESADSPGASGEDGGVAGDR